MVFYVFMNKTRFALHGREHVDGDKVRNRAGGKIRLTWITRNALLKGGYGTRQGGKQRTRVCWRSSGMRSILMQIIHAKISDWD
ncbi:MAG: hypothetical protein CVU41_05545 [Chloroflexi bacterium HGW-Chloroflexi-3]|nr:MAG: hypothetical protein CVU41_05545 [Chloroflexi bacterium HGW-Chloroflexi-3]